MLSLTSRNSLMFSLSLSLFFCSNCSRSAEGINWLYVFVQRSSVIFQTCVISMIRVNRCPKFAQVKLHMWVAPATNALYNYPPFSSIRGCMHVCDTSEWFSECAFDRTWASPCFDLISIVDARYRQTAMLRMHYACYWKTDCLGRLVYSVRCVSVAQSIRKLVVQRVISRWKSKTEQFSFVI